MNERDWAGKKRADWERLTEIVERANGRRGLRGLSRDEVGSLGPLYRRASSDLAYARAHATSEDLIAHLNDLVARAHALMYEAETSGRAWRSLANFYGVEFPTLLQRHFRYFLAAVVVSIAGGLFAYWLVISQPQKLELFIPAQFRESVAHWKSGDVSQEAQVEFSSQLMINNLNVDLISSASGVAAGVPTVLLLFNNGATLGAMSALMTQVHRHATFWPGIVPHGVAELTAMFICGAAGFLLGKSLLAPGPYRRRDAFVIAGRDAIKLVLGSIPLTIFAGIVEGMFSRLDLPPSIRYAFALVNGLLWYLYLFLPRRTAEAGYGEPLPSITARNLTPPADVQGTR